MGGGCCVGICCVMDNPVGDFFRDIADAFCPDSGCSFSPSRNDSEKHAKKIADELADMNKRVEEQTSKSVEKVLAYLNKDIASILDEIERIDSQSYAGIRLKINKQAIERKNKELENEARTLVSGIMRDRLVLTDHELSAILEERDDKKRAKNFDAFVRKLRKEANAKLRSEIEGTVRKQGDLLAEELTKRLDEVNGIMLKTNTAYEEILRLKESDEPQLEEKKIKYTYQLGVCDLILNEMDDTREAVL